MRPEQHRLQSNPRRRPQRQAFRTPAPGERAQAVASRQQPSWRAFHARELDATGDEERDARDGGHGRARGGQRISAAARATPSGYTTAPNTATRRSSPHPRAR